MPTDETMSGVLSEFARNLATDFPIQGILEHLVHRIVDILPIDAAGVTLISDTTDPRFVASSDESAMRFEQLQTELGEGPCLAAFETDSPICIPNLAEDDHFPEFARRALAEGLVAVFTFPLRDGDRRLGALDLYRQSPGALDAEEMTAAQTLADVATAYLLNAQAREDLRAASVMEHEALDKLRALDETKTEFLATIIHELRTPMTSITGYTELLQDQDLTAEQQQLLDAIVRNGSRLKALTDDLLTLSSLEQATIGQEHTPVSMCEVVTAARSALEGLVGARRLDVTYVVPSSPVMVRGDARSLERLVSNLVSNAVKFTDDGGWIRCTLTQADGWACLEVGDSGIGIPEAEQRHLFTRFFRSSMALDRSIAGSGLGLAIVESIVKRHGGRISVVSAPHRGTRMIAELPLVSSDDPVPRLPPSPGLQRRMNGR